ncbi:hypothetical protein BBAD15_g11816 [Beauveria bassiana D1-5]|uniref:Uncharacterized protein n=1 Tax=Beauveria bassiana D1-5 TaxID=1245745 RepID=A0A0A2VA32_BEABA|nr:hypothetical protein BBAD15_g11816 [Beauveria bassiana D1-5]
MNPITPAEDAASTTSDSSTRASLATPNTETEESVDFMAIREWLQLSSAGGNNGTDDPLPDDTLAIIDIAHGRVLACHPGGHLRLEEINEAEIDGPIPRRWLWLCTEKDGFTGFQSIAEGGFLGHNLRWNFMAQAPVQNGWEHFVLKRRQTGYWIQTPFFYQLWQVSALRNGSGIETRRDDHSLWCFRRVRQQSPEATLSSTSIY